MNGELDLETICAAAARIGPYVRRTPVFTSKSLNATAGADLFFKCENLQRTGAFKFRGACNAVFSLSDGEARAGVVTHSSGNHGQALALAARERQISAHIVMPSNAPAVKRAAVEGYGAQITFCEPTLDARESATETIRAESGATLVHPYNDDRVICGQGTAGLEFAEQTGRLDLLLVPVGGGGLISGVSLALGEMYPDTAIVGVEPNGADNAKRSLDEGRIVPSANPKTIADGLLTSLGDLTFPIIQKRVREIVTVSDESIATAMRLIWERMKLIVEPSSAVPLAAILEEKIDFRSKRVGIVLTGGNVDLDRLPWRSQD